MATIKTFPTANVSTADLRKSLGEICDRVNYTGESVIVKRKGRDIVAIVPVNMLKAAQMDTEKRKEKALLDLSSLLEKMKGRDRISSDEEAMDIANAAVAEVRKAKASRR